MVGGNVDYIRRRDMYSAARPSRRNEEDMDSLAWAESLRRAGLSAAAETLVVTVFHWRQAWGGRPKYG